jgi:hypothetical protein
MQGLVLALCIGSGAVADAVFARLRDVGFGRRVDRDKAVKQALHAQRQCLVGEVHVGKQGVAAKGRYLAGDQHRPHRRAFEVGRVGMPQTAEIDPLVLELDDQGDLGETLDAVMNGYSMTSPKCREKARNRSGASACPRKKITRWSSQACRIAAIMSRSRSPERSTPAISAPNAPAIGRISKELVSITPIPAGSYALRGECGIVTTFDPGFGTPRRSASATASASRSRRYGFCSTRSPSAGENAAISA